MARQVKSHGMKKQNIKYFANIQELYTLWPVTTTAVLYTIGKQIVGTSSSFRRLLLGFIHEQWNSDLLKWYHTNVSTTAMSECTVN